MKMKLKINYIIIFSFVIAICSSSCNSNDDYFAPKPKGYFRIDLPDKNYVLLDTIYPFRFEIPAYSFVSVDDSEGEGDHWFNLGFPELKGVIHFSYKKIHDNLYEYTEDAHSFVYKHVPKAEEITASEMKFHDKDVYALIYHVEGAQTASAYQFYLTDSINHFLRGALYFEHSPNNDSIQPVIDFIFEDILNLISTFEWKHGL
jgi:gliding motility-associated lipoprotein GldD